MTHPFTRLAALAALVLSLPLVAQAQTSGGSDWSSSYMFPSANDRVARTSMIDQVAKAENGYYATVGTTTYNTYNTYDNSVGSVNVNAEAGATVDASIRTAEGSGTNTYVVGAINTSNNNIQISGSDNLVDISNSASNTGCQDGTIAVVGTTLATGASLADITGGSSASATLGSHTCN